MSAEPWRERLRALRILPGITGSVRLWLSDGDAVRLDLETLSFHDGFIEGRASSDGSAMRNAPANYVVVIDRHVIGFGFTIEEATP